MLDDLHLGVRLHLREGLGHGLHIQVLDEVGPLLVVQVLQDIRQVGRVELIQLGPLRDQLQIGGLFLQVLDGVPPDEVVFPPLQQKLHPQTPGQTPQPDVHRHGQQVFSFPGFQPEDLDVIDPDHLGPFDVNDLLVHQPLAHVDLIGLQIHEPLFRQRPLELQTLMIEVVQLLHRDQPVDPFGVLDAGGLGGSPFPADGQIPQFPHPAPFMVINGELLNPAEEELPQYLDLDLFIHAATPHPDGCFRRGGPVGADLGVRP